MQRHRINDLIDHHRGGRPAEIPQIELDCRVPAAANDEEILNHLDKSAGRLVGAGVLHLFEKLTVIGCHQVDPRRIGVCDIPRHLLDQRFTLVGAKLAQVLDDGELPRPQAEALDLLSAVPILDRASEFKPYASAVIGLSVAGGAREDD